MHSPAYGETAPTIRGDLKTAEKALARKLGKPPEIETIGQRLARLRKERGITQVELAQRLGVAQPVVSDYERGELRLHGELIIKLTELLGVSSEELLGLEAPRPHSHLGNRRLLRRLQGFEQLPKRDQDALLRTIDAFLGKAS